MEKLLKDRIDLMVSNYHELKGSFTWESNLVKHFGAMVHAIKDRRVEVDQLLRIKAFMKEETGWGSYFRGVNQTLLTNLLSFEDYYKEFFASMLIVYDKMRNSNFRRSEQLPLAAYTLVKNVPMEELDLRISRMDEFYRNMKKNHSWLTSSDDYVFAALLSLTDLDIEKASEKIEDCYRLLSSMGLRKGNDLQTLSHILALGDETAKEVCPRAMKLYTGLRGKNCRLQYNGLPALGILTLVCTEEDRIIDEISEAYDYIYNQNGYGFWSMDKSMRTILSMALISSFYMDELQNDALQIALGDCIHAIIIAQQNSDAGV